MLEESTLDTTFYPLLLVEIYLGSKTGMLSISTDSELRVYFQNGSPVFAEGGDRDTLLGRVLMSTGKIDPDTHKEILEKSKNEKKRVGDVLIETGWLSPHEMNSFLELQIEERIMRGFSSLSGVYSFTENEEMPEGMIEQRIKLPKVLNEAVKRYIYAEKIEEINPKIRLSNNPNDIISSLELKPKELRMVQLLKNDMEVREILTQIRLEKYEALKLLYLLGLFKAIELPGVSLESIGRKSAERYISENRITAKASEAGDIKKNEELIELELEVYETELSIGNGIYNKSQEQDHAVLTLDEPDVEDDDVEDEIEMEEPELNEPAPQDISASEINDSRSEQEQEESETKQFPEEIKLSPDDSGTQELKLDVREISIDRVENASIGSAAQPLENSDEIQDEDSVAQEAKEAETILDSLSGTEHPDAANEDLLQETPKEITIDDTELFSTFEQEQYGFDESKDLNKVLTLNSEPQVRPEDISAGEDDEFAKRVTAFHGTISENDYYGILGVAQDAPEDEIRDAYYRLVKDYHPDVNPNIPGDIREKAQEIFTAINSAYETLSDREKREYYNSHEEMSDLKNQAQSIYDAEVEFKRGIVLLVQRDYEEAASKLGEALKINPDESAYIGAYAWARFLATEDKNGAVQDLIVDLTRAIEINPSIAENYYYLGSIHKSLDDTNKAEQNFTKALEVDPNYIEAKRELRLINSRKRNSTKTPKESSMEKRFWSGLFKK